MSTDPIGVVLQNEGGFVNHKADKGGPTNFGVTIRTYSQYLGRPASLQEVKDMKIETAREIYERSYYTGPRIHLLAEPIRTQLLDMSINHGAKAAIKMLQRVVNTAGFGPIAVDGVLGPVSRTAIDKAQKKMGKLLNNALVDTRIAFFESIVARNPSQKVFRNGWINRAEEFRIA